MEYRFYLLLIAIYIIYDNRDFLKILFGVKLENDVSLESISDEIHGANKILGRQIIQYISIFILLIQMVLYLSYFSLSIFCFNNMLFLVFTIVNIVWLLIQWPGYVSKCINAVLNPDNILQYETVEGIRFRLTKGVFSTHAILVIIMVFWIPI